MTTPKLLIPEISASQAQKEVTHNQGLRIFDAIVQATIKDRDLTAPPGSPVEGDVYIPAATATGAWVGMENLIAQFTAGAWTFITPLKGWSVFVDDENNFIYWDGAAWQLNPIGGSAKNEYSFKVLHPGLAEAGLVFFDGHFFQQAATIKKIGLFCQEAPIGADLTVDILKDGVADSKIATLTDASNFELTDIVDTNFSIAQRFGLKIINVGSTDAGNILYATIYYGYQ